jgi:hypothetical protein
VLVSWARTALGKNGLVQLRDLRREASLRYLIQVIEFIVLIVRMNVNVTVPGVFRVAIMSSRELFGVFALVRVDAATASGSLAGEG